MEPKACFRNEEIISGLKSRQVSMLKTLYEDHSPKLLGIIALRIPDQDAQQEILKKTFLSIWDDSDKYDHVNSTIFTWMLTTCIRETAAYLDVELYKMQDFFLQRLT